MRVEILGINGIADERYNNLVGQTPNVLPWLQDTATADVWNRWQITYRDVVILDAFNRPIARDNLTTHDLGNPQNYAALRQALLALAVPADTDKDGLPDVWELAWFGGLDPAPDGDFDGDGASNFEEFAFSTSPLEPADRPRILPAFARPGGRPTLAAVIRRFSGGAVDFVVETSSDLVTWSSSPSDLVRSGATRSVYDGTGAGEMRYQRTTAVDAKTAGFIRIRPVRRLPE